ncbi:MAG: sugar phosphate isomerase/epimerase [Verrucomicrobia bacterium]|nr:sugar phosphate isomerase/epimerase [Verrucomicrobiota bacterium]
MSVVADAAPAADLFARENLVAWCIVPFDAKKRGPAERAEMVKRLGFSAVAYDWRKEHVTQFEQEILEYKKHGLRYAAFWDWHDDAIALFAKHGLRPQIWVSVPNIPATAAASPAERIRLAAEKLLPRVRQAATLGTQIGLYNHGGWAGEPETMVGVLCELRDRHGATNVGIVYNLHHGHDHLDRFAEYLELMRPHLLCLNLNGMIRDGERLGKKILVLGQGDLDLGLLRTIRDSGYRGPIGLLGHTQDDVELRLRDNLDGLDWLVPQLDGRAPGPKPTPRTKSTSAK